jgi:hypothetical protein
MKLVTVVHIDGVPIGKKMLLSEFLREFDTNGDTHATIHESTDHSGLAPPS